MIKIDQSSALCPQSLMPGVDQGLVTDGWLCLQQCTLFLRCNFKEFDPEAGIQEITDEDFQVGKWNFQPEQLSIQTFVIESLGSDELKRWLRKDPLLYIRKC